MNFNNMPFLGYLERERERERESKIILDKNFQCNMHDLIHFLSACTYYIW